MPRLRPQSPPTRVSSASGHRKTEAEERATEAIRYWLATLTYQEALAARPKARRPADSAPAGINIVEPVAGQDYAKLPFAGAESFLVERHGEIRLELTGDWCGFFEHWLATRYRRGDDDENSLRQLVAFPTLHLPRDELAGLLRFPAEVQWLRGEQSFEVPTYAKRKRGEWPEPPACVRLSQLASETEQSLAFFVDAKALHDTLRIESERIDEFFNELRARPGLDAEKMVEALCQLVEEQNALDACSSRSEGQSQRRPRTPQSPSGRMQCNELLARLVAAVAERLTLVRSRARVYGVALLVCADQTRATWHLQKDLQEAKDQLEEGLLDDSSPLLGYLTGSASRAGKSTCWGRWRGAGLTDSQRAACELSLGSKLAAVQGPPGTGKTTLILNLLAHTLVRKVTALSRSGTMGRAIAVVTSTNNRAVDNVVDPLGRDLDPRSLPLALRVGSRQVVETVTLAELQRVRRWLQAQTLADRKARPLLEAELERFSAVRAKLQTRLSAEQLHQQRLERRQEIGAEITRLSATLEPNGTDRDRTLRRMLCECSAPLVREDAPRALTQVEPSSTELGDSAAAIETFVRETSRHAPVAVALRAFANRLEALSELAGGCGPRRLEETKRHWKRTKSRELATLRRALGFELFPERLPPARERDLDLPALERWEEVAEQMLEAVCELEQLLLGGCEAARSQTTLAALQRELRVLEAETAVAPPEISPQEQAEMDRRHLELFESAVQVRQAWASLHRAEISNAIDRAIRTIQDTRSLRGLIEGSSVEARWLRELFPAWGCTLLSLGNVFPADRQSAETIVIDEAGQCHPAYAVSALLRAESALIIGDVHQLEPVVGLSVEDERRIVRGLELDAGVERLAPYRAYDGSMTSAQSLADRAFATRPTLVDHFRCQPEIAAICEALCHYGLVPRTPRRTRSEHADFLTAPVLFAAIDGVQERFAGSWMNQAEAWLVLRVVRELLAAGLQPNELGIVTPYRGQLERLWRGLRELDIPLERPSVEAEADGLERTGTFDRGLAAGTVHRFQGGERSIILFTTTVTEERSLRFVDERVNLVNVAASRARDHLITIGHGPTLGAGRHTRHLIDRAAPLALASAG